MLIPALNRMALACLVLVLTACSAETGPGEIPSTKADDRAAGIPADWRYESYRNIEFAVPPGWGYGSISCGGTRKEGLVDRGNSAITLCRGPSYGVLVSRLPAWATPPPDGAVVRWAGLGELTLTVVTRDQETADIVIGSARLISTDRNGCRVEAAVPAIGKMSAGTAHAENALLSLCHYEVGYIRGRDDFALIKGANLFASEQLTAQQSVDLRRALKGASNGPGVVRPKSRCEDYPEEAATLVSAEGRDLAWIHYSKCHTLGVDLGGEPHKLTSDVVYWLLGGPFMLGMDGSIPVPETYRP
jgi:hypothetical protein